ncbi:hypothetical protein KKF05_01375 [Patescibacteria group bacterium]|nr:hypothetical protein [Patescibacteria group bacterium]MBU1028676.1 hypothetical protein [Patescibacteria group bacterium]MBU1916159.1 hypothetical protein [Patescibacteria group bacterium]
MTTKSQVGRHRCDICGAIFTCQAEAANCELRGIILPRFVAGDLIKLQVDEVLRLGLSSSEVLIDIRQFDDQIGPDHDFALTGRGVQYRVRATGGQRFVVSAEVVCLELADRIYCRQWSEFLRRANTGRPSDTEGLDSLRSMLNQKLQLGL